MWRGDPVMVVGEQGVEPLARGQERRARVRVKVLEYGVVMEAGPRGDEQVPNGVGARDTAVRLEEDDAQQVGQPT